MERRNFIRQPLELFAALVRSGAGITAGTIRDFCPGGVFVSLDPSDSSARVVLQQVQTDEPVQIRFEAQTDAGSAQYTLRARVAGVFNEGVGCEFFDPDPLAIKALEAIAAASSASSTTQERPVSAPALSDESKSIVHAVQETFSSYLRTQVNALFKKAEEALFLAARDAETNVKQNSFFDSMKDVERLREPVEAHFTSALVAQLDSLGAPMSTMQEPDDEAQGGGLSLVESGEFADWLAAKNIYTRAETSVRESLYKLDGRLGHLIDARIDEENNPVGLAAICYTFHDAVQTITTPRLARRVAFEAFDDTVIANLSEVYDELNELLVGRGVLPDLERPKPSVASKDKDPETEQQTPSPAPAEVFQPDSNPVTESFDQNVTAAQVSQTQTPGLATGQGAGTTYSAQTAPASTTVAPMPAEGGFVQQPTIDPSLLQGSPVSQPGQRTDVQSQVDAPARTEMQPPSTQEVEAELAPHPSLAGGVAFNPSTVATGHVYQSPMDVTISAFSTAQSLLSLGRQLAHSDRVPAGQPAYAQDQVRSAVSLLQAQESSLPAGAAPSVDLRTRLTRALRSRHGYADKKVIGEAESNAIDVIEQLVSSITEDPLVAAAVKPQIQRLEVPLLNAAMHEADFFSATDHPAREMVNRLGRIVGTRDGSLETPVGRAVQAAVDGVVSGSTEDSTAFTQASAQLERVLTTQAEHRNVNLEAVIKDCEGNQSKLKALGQTARPVEDKNLSPQWRQWIERAKRLNVGDTVVLDRDTDHAQRAALAWVGENHATYVFVDDQGLKASTVSLQELAMQLRKGATDVVAESELTPMDRGMYGMLRKMHDQVLHQTEDPRETDVVDRRAFESRLDELVADAQRKDSRHVVYLLDVDNFDNINQTCGRKAGDRVLRGLGRVLRKTLGATGLVAKLEDDKYGVVLENLTQDRGFEIADKHRNTVEKFQITWQGEQLQISVSIGLVEITAATETATAALTAASQARARAKSAGGNRIDIFRRDAPEVDDEASAWIKRIDDTLSEGRLELRCQKISPILDDTAKSHYEILLGLRNDKGQPELPGEFIQAAELYGRATTVDRWVIEHSFQWMAANRRRLIRLGGLSINLSAQSLSDDSTLPFVLDQFTRTRLPPGKVLFEVTEHASIQSLSNAENFIRVLKEYGCRFLLDDFGTGHSSYSYLKHLPLDYVKIDGTFIRDIVDNVNDQAMVKSINEIGHFMGKKTVAEYVENNHILEKLREMGVDYAQGFAIERPRLLAELA